MAMVALLQSYEGASDAEAVRRVTLDGCWQMVLDCFNFEEHSFSHEALAEFRHRLTAAALDKRLPTRTREVAFETKAFDSRKLPKALRVAVD